MKLLRDGLNNSKISKQGQTGMRSQNKFMKTTRKKSIAESEPSSRHGKMEILALQDTMQLGLREHSSSRLQKKTNSASSCSLFLSEKFDIAS